MKKLSSLIAAVLLISSSFAGAEATDKDDLRYCLDLPSDKEIAKCSGEISPGAKGQTYTREQVEKIIAEEKEDTAKPEGADKPEVEPEQPAATDEPAAPSGNP